MKKYLWFSFAMLFVVCTVQAANDRMSFGDLSFLEGCWKGEMDGSIVYESWGNQDGSVMLGASKTISKGQLESFEFLSVVTKDGKILYVPYVNGTNSVSFPLTQSSTATAEFSNPNHDFPKSIRYERKGSNLQVILSGDAPTIEYQLKSIACVK